VAWGWWPGKHWLVISLAVMIGIGLLSKFVWPSALVLAGGLGNWVDRLVYGGVVDYIDLGWWPSFNLGDMLIVMGVFFWLKQELIWNQR